MDITLKRRVEAGEVAGPAIDATMPYVNGPSQFVQMTALQSEERARRHVGYWADEGATSVKAYMQISRAALGTAIARGARPRHEGHRAPLLGHLRRGRRRSASTTSSTASSPPPTSSPDKEPDVCPGAGARPADDRRPRPQGRAVPDAGPRRSSNAGSPSPPRSPCSSSTPRAGRCRPGSTSLLPQLREQYLQNRARVEANAQSIYPRLFPKAMALEREFVRAGGLLVAGTDPTGGGGVIPGYANHRQLELLVEAGFTPLEAIQIGTLNGARYLGREAARRLDRAGQAGRPRGRGRRSIGGDRRRPEGGDGVQAGRGLRPGEAGGVGDGTGRAMVTLASSGPGTGLGRGMAGLRTIVVLIPSIDLKGGRIVQLVQGEALALESTDVDGWIDRFRGFDDGAAHRPRRGDGRRQQRRAGALHRRGAAVPGRRRRAQRRRGRSELLNAGATHVIVGSSLYRGARANDPPGRCINLDFASELVARGRRGAGSSAPSTARPATS